MLKYLKDKSLATNQDKFIENILKNTNMFKYNWFIERKLNINDELIKNYIDTIIERKNDYYEILWINKIWWTITFSFFFEDLVIVSDLLNNKVRFHLNEWKSKNQEIIEKKYCGLFENIIFFKKYWELYQLESPYLTKKWTYQYRKTVNQTNYEISEINWLESKIRACWIVDKILSLDDKIIQIIRNWLEKIEKNENKSSLAKLTWTKNLYNKFIESYIFKIDNSNDIKDLNFNLEMKKDYERHLKEVEKEINIIKENKIYNIEIFIELLSIKNFFKQDNYTKRDFYITFFDKIIYDENKNVTIILPDFLVKLWLPKEIIT